MQGYQMQQENKASGRLTDRSSRKYFYSIILQISTIRDKAAQKEGPLH